LADGHVGVGKEGMEFLHEVLADEVGEVDLVQGVAQNGQENILERTIQLESLKLKRKWTLQGSARVCMVIDLLGMC